MHEIKNVEKLIEVFGRYPSFHDAEILSIKLERSFDKRSSNSALTAKIRIYQARERFNNSEEKFIRWKNYEVDFEFSDIKLLQLENFNHQNVINDLIVKTLPTSETERHVFSVQIESIFGCEAFFKCNKVEIVQIKSFETVEKILQPSLETIQRFRDARNLQRKNHK